MTHESCIPFYIICGYHGNVRGCLAFFRLSQEPFEAYLDFEQGDGSKGTPCFELISQSTARNCSQVVKWNVLVAGAYPEIDEWKEEGEGGGLYLGSPACRRSISLLHCFFIAVLQMDGGVIPFDGYAIV